MNGRMRFFSLEAIRSIRSNAAISFAATATVLVAIAMLGLFLAVFSWTQGQLTAQEKKLDLRAFVKLDASEEVIASARKVLDDHPNVAAVKFLTSAEVTAEEEKKIGDVIGVLPDGYNVYPATFVIQPDDPENIKKIVADLSPNDFWLKDKTTKTGFSVDQDTTEKFIAALRVLRWGGFALMSILVIAAVFLIGNTIRLSIFARRREVEVMRLVGATNWFIRWPFIIEGLIFGLIGAIGAVLLLLFAKFLIVDRVLDVSNSPLNSSDDTSLGLAPLALIMIGSGALLGALGSGITLRRFLKV